MVKTIRQQKVIKKTIESLGKSKSLNKGKIVEDSGYSKSSVINPQRVYNTKYVKTELNSFIKQLEEKRQMVIDSLTKGKINKERAKDLTSMMDVLTKNIQLLSGEATERKETSLPDELMDKIAKERANRARIS